MSRFPNRCVIDTNVPKIANLGVAPEKIPDDLVDCVDHCIDVTLHFTRHRGLVLDSTMEIFNEYRRQLDLKGKPGVGDSFMKWVHDNMSNEQYIDQVMINKIDGTYVEYPNDADLVDCDPSDRKFIAVASAHPRKPPIYEATDSKWWGWKEALERVGVHVIFLCNKYIQEKYKKKIGVKKG